jgi:hypothetical protein
MKKTLLTLAIASIGYCSYAQSIFPTDGSNVGVGTTAPPRKFTVSNSGAEGLEIGPGNLVGDAAGAVTSVYYNRNTGTFINNVQAAASHSFAINGATPSMIINPLGNVGIGTPSPSLPLHVNGTIFSATPVSNTVGIGTSTVDNANYNFIGYQGYWGLRTAMNTSYNLDVYNGGSPITAMTVLQAGNVGIGTSTPDAKLAVNGTIHTKEVKVDLNVPGPDYVFNADYKPITLSEIKDYVVKNHHLPEIPSAAQMAKEGINLGDMNTKLLKKIEELTLYLIEKDKQVTEQQQQLSEQNKAIQSLQQQINQLAKKLKH